MAFLRWRQLAVVLVIALAASHSARADGPINPLNDPAVTAKYPPSNVFCGGPFADNLKGPRDPIFEKHFFYTKEGGDFLDTQNGNDWIFCGNGKNDVYSEDGDDVIVTGSGIDLIIGGPGSDRIWSGAGDDYVDGDPCGKGNLCAGPGVTYDDYIRLGPGNDVSIGRKGNDEIWGEDGDDKLLGNEGSDILRGGNGKDTLAGGGENEDGFDDVRGGNDDDTLYSGRGGALLYGEQGNDILRGGTGPNKFVLDAFRCGETDDVRYFNPKKDKVIVVAGRNLVVAKYGVKVLNITLVSRILVIYAPGCKIPLAKFGYNLNPKDFTSAVVSVSLQEPPSPSWMKGLLPPPIPGRGGVPLPCPDGVLKGTPFDDTLTGFNKGSTFSNYMWGENLNDTMYGGPGPDVMFGGGHNDSMFGGDGDDRMEGGSGYDVMWGEGGRDALFGGHNKKWMYGGGWGNWYTGGDKNDQYYVDAPASCAATGPAPDIINNFDGPLQGYPDQLEILWIVGSLTSVNQLTFVVDNSVPLTNVYLKGCSKPFVTVKYAGNNKGGQLIPLTSSNVRFTTKAGVPRVAPR